MRWLVFCLAIVAGPVGAAEQCLRAPYDQPTSEATEAIAGLLEDVAPVLAQHSGIAAALDRIAPEICLTDAPDTALAYLDVDRNVISLQAELPEGLKLGTFLHELRHLDQQARGLCPASDDLAMKEYARATWALEADASAVSLRMAWELRAMGDDRAWAALAAWPEQADIATRFAEAMAAKADLDGAVSVAFAQWYASASRREAYYIATCSDYLQRLDESHALPRYERLAPEFFAALCVLPNGVAFACAEPALPAR